MKIQLVEDWKQAWKFWSVRIWVILAALPQVLPLLGAETLAYLPTWLGNVISVAALLGVVARVVKQPSLQPDDTDKAGA